jgi:hypothetical protein
MKTENNGPRKSQLIAESFQRSAVERWLQFRRAPLRERGTIVAATNLPHNVPVVRLKQIPGQTGFGIAHVAAPRAASKSFMAGMAGKFFAE